MKEERDARAHVDMPSDSDSEPFAEQGAQLFAEQAGSRKQKRFRQVAVKNVLFEVKKDGNDN
eukprot:CAMPEP_0185165944 /NCGR_PEP_ID=MMETSP1139-20130426/11717_1 /TAXON_ID=298111 /ORGANISM="Pavlova sp., Strain CCMP459" /LENGTH=61 /DNA_ID=CAMNT_0027731371 /DNA_START=51 /DNA_END=236 /DNA_ORIENTATION=+